MILNKLYKEFFNSEKAGGLILVIMTITSMIIANSSLGTTYINFWNREFGSHTVTQWINDGLMSIFFLLIGLELKRELYKGELSNLKNALLPIFAAVGGMIIPATIYSLLNFRTDYLSGAGIPMATDIAFAIGILSLLGKRVPASLKIFLTALATVDDLGAIIVIAVFYTRSVSLFYLLIVLGVIILLIVLNRLKVNNLIPYLLGGIVMWFFMSKSGVHPTITGVILAFILPCSNGDENTPSCKLQHVLHKPVAFFILPLFALANTCIAIDSALLGGLRQSYSIGIILGLVIGKPLGIWLFSLLGVKLGFCSLPSDLSWKNIVGAGVLGGIGFTMSIFITFLAFNNLEMINISKTAILIGSLISGILGLLILELTLRNQIENMDKT